MTATEMADGVREARFSAVELTREALKLAKTEGSKLNAFITLCEDKALKQAHTVDKVVKKSGEQLPLAGVPIAIKDNICYSACRTTCASHILENFIPPYDATCVTKLIQAGAVIIGKTNMDEFGMGSSNENSYFGHVANPTGEHLVPGGSSGGSAAAVARGIVPIALGSDTGGSVRQPAAFCGVFGFKPSYGAVSRYGLVAFGSSLDQIGPLARNNNDLTLTYSVIGGYDQHDSTSVDFTHPDYFSAIETDRKFRFGIPKEYFSEGLDPEVENMVKNTVQYLKTQGHSFVDVSLPLTKKAIAVYYIIAPAEASSNLARFDGVRYGLRKSSDKTLLDMYNDTRSSGFGAEVKRRIMLGTHVLSSGYIDAYYLKASRVRELLKQEFENVFESVDLLITPTTPTGAFGFGEKSEDPLAMYLSDIYTVPANLAGIPAISIPCGKLSDNRPVGVQFMARPFDELSLLQVANILEKPEAL